MSVIGVKVDHRKYGDKEIGDELIVFLCCNCPKAFLTKANALVRLPQTVTHVLSRYNWLLGVLLYGSNHNLLTISLTHGKAIGNNRMAQFLYWQHIPQLHSHLNMHHSMKQTNVIFLLGQTNKTHYTDNLQVVLPKIRTGLNYWKLFVKSKTYQLTRRSHWRHCAFLCWGRNRLGKNTYKQHFLPRGTMCAFGILFPVREPGKSCCPPENRRICTFLGPGHPHWLGL